jgi:transposase
MYYTNNGKITPGSATFDFELQPAVTAEELADMLGISQNTIYSSMANWKKGRTKTSPYRKVVIK